MVRKATMQQDEMDDLSLFVDRKQPPTVSEVCCAFKVDENNLAAYHRLEFHR